MFQETEYKISLCGACSKNYEKNNKLKCMSYGQYDEAVFFDCEEFMKENNLGQSCQCDVLYRQNDKFFLFIELKMQDKFFVTQVDRIVGLKTDLKKVDEIAQNFFSKLESSLENYIKIYGDIDKEIDFYVVFSSKPLRSKWDVPSITNAQLKDYIRKRIFRKITNNYIEQKCIIDNHKITLKVCDCDDLMQII